MDNDKMGTEPNGNLCLCLSLCYMNTFTQFYTSDFLSLSVSISTSRSVNTPLIVTEHLDQLQLDSPTWTWLIWVLSTEVMVGGKPALCNALFPTEGAAAAVGVVAVAAAVANGSVVAGVDVVVVAAAAAWWRAWRGCGPSRRRAAF